MKPFLSLSFAAVIAMSANPAVAQGPAAAAPTPSVAAASAMDCAKPSRLRHDHAAERGAGSPPMRARPCPPVASASATAAMAAKKKARHDHAKFKNL